MCGCPPRGWAPCSQSRSVTRTDRFQNQMVVTGDSFLGVRLLSAESVRVSDLQRYLGCTNRPQGFSPSRRRSPTRTSWLCFTPHPPIGFWSSEPFPPRQPWYLSIPAALLSLRQPAGFAGVTRFPLSALAFFRPPRPPSARCYPEVPSCSSVALRTSSSSTFRLASDGRLWRAARAFQRVVARRSLGSRLTLDG